jgi:glycosyltransferase involved in cell wall biosynthesis
MFHEVMADLRPLAAIRAEPDGYDTSRPELMGRHAAGQGFLRAMLAARDGRPVLGVSPSAAAFSGFSAIAKQIDPRVEPVWARPSQGDRIGQAGTLYLGDCVLSPMARLRLRAGVAAYSLCGVTHTTATNSATDQIASLCREPIMPWDALICTSEAVVETVRQLRDAEAEYLRWRFGRDVLLEGPRLPVIPLGIHCDDFSASAQTREGARRDLGLDGDVVAALYLGRLVPHGKAHPLAMYRALQQAAVRSGKPIALILCGWAATPEIENAFRRWSAEFAPDVRLVMLDGRLPDERSRAWAAADLFLSLVDGIQETFGLTPVEAMAAGLPVVVSDWNGYRDTVRDGVDGFRIRTWAPMPGMGAPIAAAFEEGVLDYPNYCWAAAITTALDEKALSERILRLVENDDLRRSMGAAGQARARSLYDWPVVFAAYEALWAELAERRSVAAASPAPRSAPGAPDPFSVFGHYPTEQITPRTRIVTVQGAAENLEGLAAHEIFSGSVVPKSLMANVWSAAEHGHDTIASIAAALRASEPAVARAAGVLAKMGLVRLA